MKRKLFVSIGVALSVGAVFWAREMASWRPVTVAKVGFALHKIEVSRDGQWLLVENEPPSRGAVVNLSNGDYDSASDAVRAFNKEHGTEVFPRVSMKEGDMQLTFSPAPHRDVPLTGISPTNGLLYFLDGTLGFPTGWSKQRGEVYCAIRGVIWACDWKTGKLKKRVRYTKSISRSQISSSKSGVFSPDGKWFLAVEEKSPTSRLRRYDVQSGKMVAFVAQKVQINEFGFSPDGRYIWLASNEANFEVISTLNASSGWSANYSSSARWLADNRIGISQRNGFEWLNASGRLIRHLPGPFQNPMPNSFIQVGDWVESPDGNWIYSCESDGTIRRWRAR